VVIDRSSATRPPDLPYRRDAFGAVASGGLSGYAALRLSLLTWRLCETRTEHRGAMRARQWMNSIVFLAVVGAGTVPVGAMVATLRSSTRVAVTPAREPGLTAVWSGTWEEVTWSDKSSRWRVSSAPKPMTLSLVQHGSKLSGREVMADHVDDDCLMDNPITGKVTGGKVTFSASGERVTAKGVDVAVDATFKGQVSDRMMSGSMRMMCDFETPPPSDSPGAEGVAGTLGDVGRWHLTRRSATTVVAENAQSIASA
jgi:hypothetical protein